MNADVTVDATATTAHLGAKCTLSVPTLGLTNDIDIDWKRLIDFVPALLQARSSSLVPDLILISSVVYGLDKLIPRNCEKGEGDRWTRQIEVTIPVDNDSLWDTVAEGLSECISFLTGDVWTLTFSKCARSILCIPRGHKPKRGSKNPVGGAVSLLSGGLDSFIGALDWLEANGQEKLVLVGHTDRHVGGPGKDQLTLLALLKQLYPGRVSFAQTRVGLSKAANEHSYRSRSFVFLALAVSVAELINSSAPVLIPENGVIALNYPLSASRRGSCSTRTVHPKFLRDFRAILQKLGITHSVENPLRFKTKGEAVEQCLNRAGLIAGYQSAVSCAKSGHKKSWDVQKGRSCGQCIPCLFRRASLHTIGLDTQVYGVDIGTIMATSDLGDDLRDLLRFVRQNPNSKTVVQELSSGGVPLDADARKYSEMIPRMRNEVIVWLKAKSSSSSRAMAGL
jgi:7-cyano-7-deazaguanine synthase in queuosine biosynthesis